MAQKTDNIWISLFVSFFHFLTSTIQSIVGLITGKGQRRLIRYANLDGILKEIPNLWGKHPNGIGLGRSVVVSILYFFQKHAYFHEKK